MAMKTLKNFANGTRTLQRKSDPFATKKAVNDDLNPLGGFGEE